jgi:hypothetical protein
VGEFEDALLSGELWGGRERELNDQRFRASFIEERTPDGRLVGTIFRK